MAVDVREQVEAGTAEAAGPQFAGLPHPGGPGGWTVADLELLPDDGLRYELLDGTLLVSPSPTPRHQVVSAGVYRALIGACPASMHVLYAPLDWQPNDERSFEPDLLVLRRNDVGPERLTGVPVLLVEILSPSTATIDRTVKFNAYAAAGVGQYWIVDPGVAEDGADCVIEVYDLVDGAYVLQVRGVGADEITVAGPVPATLVSAELLR